MLELIIVVSIIGVLAAIAVPRLSHGAENSGRAAQREDWSRLSRQIELYAVEHAGVYPGRDGFGVYPDYSGDAFTAQMVQWTDLDGAWSTEADEKHGFGPYLRGGLPKLKFGPYVGHNSVYVGSDDYKPAYDPDNKVGWLFNADTGELAPNAPMPGVGVAGAKELGGEAAVLEELGRSGKDGEELRDIGVSGGGK